MSISAFSSWVRFTAGSAALLGVLAGIYAMFWPTYSDGSTLIEQNGSGLIGVISTLTVLSLLPTLVVKKWRRTACLWSAALLAGSMFVSVLGMLYFPSALLLGLAWWSARDERAEAS